MATQSFYEDLVLDSPEAVHNLEKAIDEADRRGPLRIRIRELYPARMT